MAFFVPCLISASVWITVAAFSIIGQVALRKKSTYELPTVHPEG
jgi:hypothetical protein